MIKWLVKIADGLLYSNIWIAFCAAVMTLQTQYVLTKKTHFGMLVPFVFFATLALYGLHRLVGISKVASFQQEGRYSYFFKHQRFILFLTFLSSTLGGVLFLLLPVAVKIGLCITALPALAYVLPIFYQKKMLRDIHGIKIFFLAFVWSAVTVGLVAVEQEATWGTILLALFLERVFFTFAIAIPFDIRDLKVDQYNGVETIPSLIGINNSKILATCSLVGMLMCSFAIWQSGTYSAFQFAGLLVFGFVSGVGVWNPFNIQDDYYYSGVLDGMMVLQGLVVLSF